MKRVRGVQTGAELMSKVQFQKTKNENEGTSAVNEHMWRNYCHI